MMVQASGPQKVTDSPPMKKCGLPGVEQLIKVHIQANGQGNKAEDGRRSRQDNRVEPGAAGKDDGFAQGHSLGSQHIGEFDQQNAILHHDTGQGNNAGPPSSRC